MPIWVAMIINSLLGFIDFLFLSKFSQSYLIIIGIAYIPFTFISTALTGIGIEINRMAARKDKFNTKLVILISLIIAIIFLFLSIVFAEYILFFAKENKNFKEISEYFKILSLLIIPSSLFYVCTGILRGNGVPKKTLKFNISVLILNILFDFLFIYLNILSSPLIGCAIASVISEFLVSLFYINYILKSKYVKKDKMDIKKFLKNSLTYSLEKIFSLSSLQLILALYIVYFNEHESFIFFSLDRYFLPLFLLPYAYFEWIIYIKSKNDFIYKSEKDYLMYLLVISLYNILIVLFIGFSSVLVVYSILNVLYCFFFLVERAVVAKLLQKKRGKMLTK